MGLYDRDYTQDGYGMTDRYSPGMRFSFPQLTPMVKWLLIANIGVFFLQIIVEAGTPQIRMDPITYFFSVYPRDWWFRLQVWRLLTYQFLHGGFWHIAMNMLGLYFLGPVLERHWGSTRFLVFYLGCGVAGGLLYTLLAAVGWLNIAPMLGASGAILGLLAACAILFPQFVVFIFLFPVPIRIAALLFGLGAAAVILSRGYNAGGQAAHFGGMIAGAFYVLFQARADRFVTQVRKGQWERRMASERNLEVQVDRILKKVQESGIHSLTRAERATLKRATEAEQRRRGQA